MTPTISTSHVATLLKKTLRTAYPDTTFSVRKDRESGRYLEIRWTDGPSFDEVRKLAKPMQGMEWGNSTYYRRFPVLVTVTIKGEEVTGWPLVHGFMLFHALSPEVKAEAARLWSEAHRGATPGNVRGKTLVIDGQRIESDWADDQISGSFGIAELVVLPRIAAKAAQERARLDKAP